MTDHLPECPMKPIAEAPVDFHQVFPDCICDRLLACEQRVAGPLLKAGHDWLHTTGYSYGYAIALNAAEAAVAASWSWPSWEDDGQGEQEVMFVRDALTAIRALKEKP